MKKGKRRHGNSVLRIFVVGLSFLFNLALLLALAFKLSDVRHHQSRFSQSVSAF